MRIYNPHHLSVVRLKGLAHVRKIIFVLLCVFLLESVYAAGYRQFDVDGMRVGVWYPSDKKEKAHKIGPFDTTHALNAPIKSGAHQVILISHGFYGRKRNHHLTAKALADNGFIVIAPTHNADYLIDELDNEDTYRALYWRTLELLFSLEVILQKKDFRSTVDLSVIHGLGYSLGSMTVLQTAGAGMDGILAESYCQKTDDPNFCESEPSWFEKQRIKWYREGKTPNLLHLNQKKYFNFPIINGNIALIAPVGQGIKIDENIFKARKVLIVEFTEDKINPPKWHAQNLLNIIPIDLVDNYLKLKAKHNAFISPFTKRATDNDFIKEAIDPREFDRKKFIDDLNRNLVVFFSKTRK